MKKINMTITLHSYLICEYKTKITKADHDIVMASVKSNPEHHMDCGRVVAFSKDALKNLQKHVDAFIKDLKERVYDDVVIDKITIIDALERHLPQR